MRARAIACALVWIVAACSKEAPAPTPPPVAAASDADAAPEAVDIEDPATCRPCHEAVVDEWLESMHARAHHSRDPIYAGVREVRMKREGAAIAEACETCHTPRAAGGGAGKPELGVTCAACHHVASVKPGALGHEALVRPEGPLLLGPHDAQLAPGELPAHGSGPAPKHMKEGRTLCLACHGELSAPSGVAMCSTGPEHEAQRGGSQDTCVSCHMPLVDGPSGAVATAKTHRSHHFAGPHRAWYQDDPSLLRRAAELEARFEGEALIVTVTNTSGHGFPTGFPGRRAHVQVDGFDAGGARIWQSTPAGQSPMQASEPPEAAFGKVYVDAEGQPTLAPFAVKLARDSRLKPSEARTLRFSPPAEVERVEVLLVMRLMPPKLAKKIGLEVAIEAGPRTLKSVRLRR